MPLYFAYRSNMDPVQMARRCRDSRLVGVGVLDRHAFLINRRGVATVVPAPDDSVEGVLWELSGDDLDELDIWEGTASGHYARSFKPVRIVETGGTVPAVVYVAADGRCGPGCRPGYGERVLSGARQHGLSAAYLARLEALLGLAAPAAGTAEEGT
ncbi:gamma-glutamylcyclotransferase family protein [Azospirillum sp. SYSU D00513]|uniref:gamma-glutamylcyclotransferase family protein n=1 Tax=Azospirillum sp. SYSU D00513 TaxID=2812561 RepID=UPI001A95BACF|nr:gamma-glutamylcyclotransferase family protein [Azospirillum sp. SYSU D00513]